MANVFNTVIYCLSFFIDWIVENNLMIKYIVLIHCLLNLTKFYKNSYLFLETMKFVMYSLYWIIIHTVGECFVKQIYYLSVFLFENVVWSGLLLSNQAHPLPFPTFQISTMDSLNLTSWWLLELWSEDYIILEGNVSRLVLLF